MDNPKPREKHQKVREHFEDKPQPKFKSSFKGWIRVVAFILVIVFVPEQVAQAIEYDWRVLWQRQAANTFAPSHIIRNIQSLDVPLAVRNILRDISGKPVDAIQLSPTVILRLEKPLNISKKRIEEIYNWLQGKTCGSRALYDYLRYQGAQIEEQDLAVLALTTDILNDVVRPEGNPTVIKNSLYALSATAKFFGAELYPVKISTPTSEIQGVAPFIAHLKGDHYILVNKITEEKVYYLDRHKEEFVPLEKFFKEFSGYALVANLQLSTANSQILTENEAKQVLGARQSYSSPTNDIMSDLLGPPKWEESAINLGVAVGTAALTSFVGGTNFIETFAIGQVAGSVGQTAALIGYRYGGMSAESAQLLGYGVSGVVSGAYAGPKFFKNTFSSLGSFGKMLSSSPALSGAIIGGVTGVAQGYLTQQLQKSFSGMNDSLRYSLSSFLGSAGATIGVNTLLGGIGGMSKGGGGLFKGAWTGIKGTFITLENGKPLLNSKGGYILTPFTVSTISQGIGLGIEAALSKSLQPRYSRMLGQAIGALGGAYLSYSIDPTVGGKWFTSDNKSWQAIGNAAIDGLLSAGISYGLTSLADSFKNKEIIYASMPAMTMLLSNALYAAYHSLTGSDYLVSIGDRVIPKSELTAGQIANATKAGFTDVMKYQFTQLSQNLLTYGGTLSPANAEKLAPFMGTFKVAQFNAKITEMFGLDLLAERARIARQELIKKGGNPEDWRKQKLFPDYLTSLNNYLSSTYHYAAVDTLVDLVQNVYSNQIMASNPKIIKSHVVNLVRYGKKIDTGVLGYAADNQGHYSVAFNGIRLNREWTKSYDALKKAELIKGNLSEYKKDNRVEYSFEVNLTKNTLSSSRSFFDKRRLTDIGESLNALASEKNPIGTARNSDTIRQAILNAGPLFDTDLEMSNYLSRQTRERNYSVKSHIAANKEGRIYLNANIYSDNNGGCEYQLWISDIARYKTAGLVDKYSAGKFSKNADGSLSADNQKGEVYYGYGRGSSYGYGGIITLTGDQDNDSATQSYDASWSEYASTYASISNNVNEYNNYMSQVANNYGSTWTSVSSGSITGSSFSGTGTIPHLS
ncbi:MAG: cysteine peptidase family C39 domain-containing protein, partial [Candidatus Omnitrophica bacterium]|nr:cysteine peptidase family C39 domain-containing protein [Candidatus Omnitrophota bacterium]